MQVVVDILYYQSACKTNILSGKFCGVVELTVI